jgi:hypothetical protein
LQSSLYYGRHRIIIHQLRRPIKHIESCSAEKFILKPEGKSLLGRPRRRWMDNIKIYLKEIGWDCMTRIDLAQSGSIEGSCEHGKEPSVSIKCWEVLE